MFGSQLVMNYFENDSLDFIFNGFYATRKINQMFIVFSVFTQTHKNKSIVNLYYKELLECFSEDIKILPSHNVLIW